MNGMREEIKTDLTVEMEITILPKARQTELMAGWQEENQPFKSRNDLGHRHHYRGKGEG